MTPEQAVEKYSQLVYKMAHKVNKSNNHRYQLDDLYQAGILGLLKACNTYDAKKNAQLITWIYRPVLWSILQFIQKEKRQLHYIDVDVNIMGKPCNNQNLIELLDGFSEEEQNIIYRSFIDDESAHSLSLSLDMSYPKTQKTINNLMERLKIRYGSP